MAVFRHIVIMGAKDIDKVWQEHFMRLFLNYPQPDSGEFKPAIQWKWSGWQATTELEEDPDVDRIIAEILKSTADLRVGIIDGVCQIFGPLGNGANNGVTRL